MARPGRRIAPALTRERHMARLEAKTAIITGGASLEESISVDEDA